MPLHHHTTHGGDPLSQPPPKPETKVLSLLLKAIIMILVTTLFFLFLGLATALLILHLCLASAIHRRRHSHSHSHGSTQFPISSGFSSYDLKKLSQFRFSNWVKPQSQTECVVCLDGFRDGQWCRKLGGCGHVFHRKCVDAWLVKVRACPICRTRVKLEVGGSSSVVGVEEEEAKELWAFDRHTNWRVW